MFNTLFNPFVKLFGCVAFFPPDLHIPQEQFSNQFQAAGESAEGHIPHDSHDNSQHSQTTGTSVLHGKKKRKKEKHNERNMVTSTREKIPCSHPEIRPGWLQKI